MTTTTPFRILSLDGGGLKGAFTAGFLAHLEQLIGEPLSRHFDLITGTSTGGIIGLGIGLGVPAADILRFYREEGPKIFPAENRGLMRLWRTWRRPKYDGVALQAALTAVFGNRTLGEYACPLLIPAFQVNQGKVAIFKTPHHSDYIKDHQYTAVEVGRATSAAPYFLPPSVAGDGLTYVDGGIAVNNPALLAVIEALTTFEQPREAIHVLSIGCPGPVFDLPTAARTCGGGKAWISSIVPTVLAAQGALLEGCVLKLVPHGQCIRRCIPTGHHRFQLDASDFHDELAGLGHVDAAACFAQLRPLFFAPRIIPPFPGRLRVA